MSTLLWSKFEQAEALAQIKKPECMRENSLQLMRRIVEFGILSGDLSVSEITSMESIINELAE